MLPSGSTSWINSKMLFFSKPSHSQHKISLFWATRCSISWTKATKYMLNNVISQLCAAKVHKTQLNYDQLKKIHTAFRTPKESIIVVVNISIGILEEYCCSLLLRTVANKAKTFCPIMPVHALSNYAVCKMYIRKNNDEYQDQRVTSLNSNHKFLLIT